MNSIHSISLVLDSFCLISCFILFTYLCVQNALVFFLFLVSLAVRNIRRLKKRSNSFKFSRFLWMKENVNLWVIFVCSGGQRVLVAAGKSPTARCSIESKLNIFWEVCGINAWPCAVHASAISGDHDAKVLQQEDWIRSIIVWAYWQC